MWTPQCGSVYWVSADLGATMVAKTTSTIQRMWVAEKKKMGKRRRRQQQQQHSTIATNRFCFGLDVETTSAQHFFIYSTTRIELRKENMNILKGKPYQSHYTFRSCFCLFTILFICLAWLSHWMDFVDGVWCHCHWPFSINAFINIYGLVAFANFVFYFSLSAVFYDYFLSTHCAYCA